ncbi:MAG: polymer-forming cytoskeletal protein [Patescibacteria group bacterium]|nr:polymer-forming cytoskeletal protein [Patescibacteria group bacterium]
MFKKEDGNEVETVIGPSVQVEGNFVANGDVIIEGIVSGSIKTEKNLHIGAEAKIFADVYAANAVIAGEVQGNIKVKDGLELTNTAKIFGDIKAQVLTINAGAVLHGKCDSGDERKSKLEKIEEREKNKAKETAQPMAEKIK